MIKMVCEVTNDPVAIPMVTFCKCVKENGRTAGTRGAAVSDAGEKAKVATGT